MSNRKKTATFGVLYRVLFDEALDAIFVADAETGLIFDCNKAATELVGRSKAELIGMHQRLLHPEMNVEEFSSTFRQHLSNKKGQVLETQVITKNGEVKDVAIKANVVEFGGRKFLYGVFRDITENKKAFETCQLHAKLLNSIGQAVTATDAEGRITYWNKAAEQLYGLSRDEVLGRHIMDIFGARLKAGVVQDVVDSLKTGKSLTKETTISRNDGTAVHVLITISPINDLEGKFSGGIGVSTDISEKTWMLEVLEDAIKHVAELNSKLHTVERLTNHDIRNKLTIVDGRIFLLKKRIGDNPLLKEHVEAIAMASKQILQILEFQRVYVQIGSEDLTYVEVGKLMDEAVSLFSPLENTQIINECHGLTVLADSLLRQIFYNLIDNTLKYGEKVTKIKLYFKEDGESLKIIYEDNGVGIPEEVKNKLFSEGFGKGTGYGLYLIKKICETYGWQIQETGKHGQGAQFTMTIPKLSQTGKKTYDVKS
ncbi:MAG: PAS domain S-box protein [Candidatus Bathyarchaeota archaeon]|nr:PAS domain S-box protein [Candidatus Bathyarchaeota archaeon]